MSLAPPTFLLIHLDACAIIVGFFRAAQDRIDRRVLHPDSVVRGWQAHAAGFASRLARVEGLAQQARFLPPSPFEILNSTTTAAYALNNVLASYPPRVVAEITDLEARWRWKDAGLRRKPRGNEWLAFQALLDAGETQAAYRLVK